ncbi:MAG: hypothetical protein EA367_01070 [Leptolyngbya sp. DLM2.Bin15]|nr:MAG: hypothetical protein EA367_01070 [Leptolyngbya sp. DLM2.Bin15]
MDIKGRDASTILLNHGIIGDDAVVENPWGREPRFDCPIFKIALVASIDHQFDVFLNTSDNL